MAYKVWTLEIFHPKRLGKPFHQIEAWAYVGSSLRDVKKIEDSALGKKPLWIKPEEFALFVKNNRRQLVAWVDEHYAGLDPALRLKTPLHKNPYFDDLLHHLFFIAYLKNRFKHPGEHIAVVTTCFGLARALLLNKSVLGCKVKWHSQHVFRAHFLIKNLRVFAGLLHNSIYALFQMSLSRLYFSKKYLKRLNGVQILIDTYVYAGDFSKSGDFHERYLPGIFKWLKAKEGEAAYYPFFYQVSLIQLGRVYERLRKSKTLFCLPERYLVLSDWLYALNWSLRPIRQLGQPASVWQGVDVFELINSYRFLSSWRAFWPCLLWRVSDRLFKSGLRIRLYIDWFENQPIDQACVLGFRKAFSQARIVGVRHVWPYDNWLSLFSTEADENVGVTPQENWVAGKMQQQLYASYHPKGHYKVVPAFRYQGIKALSQKKLQGNKLGVFLPFSYEETVHILMCLGKIVHEKDYFDSILLKLHPSANEEKWKNRLLKQVPFLSHKILKWTSQTSTELFSHVQMVVTGGSGTAVEALCVGLPVIVMVKKIGLCLHPLENFDPSLWQLAYDEKDLQIAVQKWMPHHPLPGSHEAACGPNLLQECFGS